MAIGKAIRRARGSMTQEQLAALIAVDQPTLSKWERNLQRASFEHIRAVEDATNRPRGFVLVAAGLVEKVTTVEDAIAMDPTIDDRFRDLLLTSVQGARLQVDGR